MDELFPNRFELKYITRWDTYERLVQQLRPFAVLDGRVNSSDRYSIISLYYDSPDLRFYWDKIDGLAMRNKVRVRQYGGRSSQEEVFVEIKRKLYFSVKKLRVRSTLAEAYNMLESPFGRQQEALAGQEMKLSNVQSSIIFLRDLHSLRPQVIISYDRQPYVGIYENRMRITFDLNIRCRSENLRIEDGPWGDYILSPEFVLMEIKLDGKMPEWMPSLIAEHNLEPIRFSKYCLGLERSRRLQSRLVY